VRCKGIVTKRVTCGSSQILKVTYKRQFGVGHNGSGTNWSERRGDRDSFRMLTVTLQDKAEKSLPKDLSGPGYPKAKPPVPF